jgi:hypothetical protein
MVGETVLGEALVERELLGSGFILHAGFIAHKCLPHATGGIGPVGAPGLITRLNGNWPNPFNPATTVGFDLGSAGQARFTIYDVTGRRVRTLLKRGLPAGKHEIRWDGRSDTGHAVASGLYVVEMVAGGYRARHKMILAR